MRRLNNQRRHLASPLHRITQMERRSRPCERCVDRGNASWTPRYWTDGVDRDEPDHQISVLLRQIDPVTVG